MSVRLAIVGLGKIARDQHLPAIADTNDFELAATVDPANAGMGEVPHFDDLDTLIGGDTQVDAVAVCSPPQLRYRLAAKALEAGKHVLLEKPPCATLSEARALIDLADRNGCTLFAAWHSRFASGVGPAREWLRGKTIRSVAIDWREDVRVWHPGQAWIFEAGGFGVFDPAINALSIVTAVLPRALMVQGGELEVPSNRAAPIAGRLDMQDTDGVPVRMVMDFLKEGPQSWDIVVQTDSGELALSQGGRVLQTPGHRHEGEDREYAGIYSAFADTIGQGRSDADLAPLRLVADAFLRARNTPAEEFHE
ncbi:Gfo/Idh/MocA family protein [Aurantiacibacter poecillastricola]|uniref:Gfo/Idh/MocA family protein n=1 Tax=Aurantiacibacter poecillastricola TaxID=3064385 RepID=UPI00273D3289|nr:Gfo/Idh/MocA family oxidoreductase [Aurantiacibacter sp. 219JJ12-13]MDP5260269.1 Gfo/Idh/MocA family oxidoreductase [Aurantiacibacter sp. 219JJ12-13]